MIKFASIFAATLVAASPAQAATLIIPDSGDTGWLLASLLVGLGATIPALLLIFTAAYGRSESLRMLPASIAGMALVALLYFLIGYSLMFDLTSTGAFSGMLGGGTNWMLNLMGTLREGTSVAETGFAAFQLGFVLVAVTLLTGALASRARPGWLLGFTALWFLLVLVPVTRWIWGGGWLADWGALDTSGGLTIFYAAGVSALVAMAMVGSTEVEDPAVDPAGLLCGAALLLLGLLAFTGGATLGAGDNAAVAMLAMLTSAATGALTLAAARRSLDAQPMALGLMAGTIAALTAGDGLSIGGAFITGLLGALAVAIAPRVMPKRISWHDKGDLITTIIAAAKTGGFFAAVFLAFMPFGGSGYPDGMGMIDQIIAQTIAIVAIAAWSAIGTVIAALMMGMVVPMRRA